MTIYGLVAEDWERAFAWSTYDALRRSGVRDRVLVPDFLLPAPAKVEDHAGLEPVACGEGFVPRQAVRQRLRQAAGADLLQVIDAGALPHANTWCAPVHGAPSDPRHDRERIGSADVWRIDTGTGYFKAIDAAAGYGPVWGQYGGAAPVFVCNTNDFNEPPPPPCRSYVILGSGLLGLRLVLESQPPADARLIVYDLNPHQIAWIEFVLANAHRHATLAALVEAFRFAHPGVQIRPVASHEQENAERQERWYRDNAGRLAALARLPRQAVPVDLMSDPSPLFRLLPGGGPTFFMYLDLFMVWQQQGDRLVIRDLAALAEALETAVVRHVEDRVIFTPGAASSRLQLWPGRD